MIDQLVASRGRLFLYVLNAFHAWARQPSEVLTVSMFLAVAAGTVLLQAL